MKKPNESTYISVKFASGDYEIVHYDHKCDILSLGEVGFSWENFLAWKQDPPVDLKPFSAKGLHSLLKHGSQSVFEKFNLVG